MGYMIYMYIPQMHTLYLVTGICYKASGPCTHAHELNLVYNKCLITQYHVTCRLVEMNSNDFLK